MLIIPPMLDTDLQPCDIRNFMLYKMIYFSSHKFAFSNLRFSSFYEHFRQLREKYAFKLKIRYMLISSLSPIWWCAYISLFLKVTTPLHSTPTQNILLAVNPFHCFFAKRWWARKKSGKMPYSQLPNKIWNTKIYRCRVYTNWYIYDVFVIVSI